jgi:hypothetical protein
MNSMSRNYAREKFGSAVEAMASSPASIQDRLEDAYLTFHPVQVKDLKEGEEQDLFQDIYDSLTREEAVGDEGRVKATLNKMSDEEASRIASQIVALNFRLSDDD